MCGYTNCYLILPIDQNSTFPPIAPKWMKLNALDRNKTTKIIVEVVTTDVRKIRKPLAGWRGVPWERLPSGEFAVGESDEER